MVNNIQSIFERLVLDTRGKPFTVRDFPYLNPIIIRVMSIHGVITRIKSDRTWKKEPALWTIVPGADMKNYIPYRKRPSEYRLALYKCQAINCPEIREIYNGKRPAHTCGIAKRSISEISLCPKRLI